FVQLLRAFPVALGALDLRLRGIHGGLGIQLFLRTRAVAQFGETRFVGLQVRGARLDVCRQSLLLPLHRRLRLGKLRFGRLDGGDLRGALCNQLVAVEAGDELAFLDGVAFVHGSLDQTPGGFEGDIDLGELDVAGDYDPVFGLLVAAAIDVEGRSGGNQYAEN